MLTQPRPLTIQTPGATPTTSPREGPQRPAMGSAVATGALLGFLAVDTVVSTVALLAGVDLVGALAVGTFAGLWDGLGMGAMFAAVRYAQRSQDHPSGRQPMSSSGIGPAVSAPAEGGGQPAFGGEGPVARADGRITRRDHAGRD